MQGIDDTTAFDYERRLWPARILGHGIRTFVVPIRPGWARELFDSRLAAQTLLPPRSELMLNTENVYYRSVAFANGLGGRSRILWYVTASHSVGDLPAIRAVSLCDEVVTGPARDLFKVYRRLGVYDWDHVYSLAKSDASTQIMAVRFGMTLELPRPVGLRRLREAYASSHSRPMPSLQSPFPVDESLFQQIMREASA